MASTTASSASEFNLTRILNQGKSFPSFPFPSLYSFPLHVISNIVDNDADQGGRRLSLLGTLTDSSPAILIVERAPFPSGGKYARNIPRSLRGIDVLGGNDVYHWALAGLDFGGYVDGEGDGDGKDEDDKDDDNGKHPPDVKLTLIHPCTDSHITKYSKQRVRAVTETPDIYRKAVRPYMQRKRQGGRLNWVYNILQGLTEVEDVIYRTPPPPDPNKNEAADDEGFVLLPDLNWDRATLEALHLLALVERRDMWSLRDLCKKHVPWLQHMRRSLVAATVSRYPSLEPDQLKLYFHYQPTYYHLHIHIVHVALDAGPSQAIGKAVGLDAVIETLQAMAGDDDAGMDTVSMTYTLGEASELWTEFLNSGHQVAHAGAMRALDPFAAVADAEAQAVCAIVARRALVEGLDIHPMLKSAVLDECLLRYFAVLPR
ncbi:hypothetical protein CP532_1976 [Ophiocordyceps camponoti-leonardi (nom. inval.)]|nr:hypothetical protein CP532_1976 [Ophiocordyceps camponoti-leonardi (nom. inval.)]